VPARHPFSYAVVRVVPRVEREEFINAGVVVFCDACDFLAAQMALDEERLLALAPSADVTLIRRHLEAIPLVCAGDATAGAIASLSLRERWQWLVAPRSTILQLSAAHTGLCEEPQVELDRLATLLIHWR
jgi:hypothetical protein